MSNPRINDEVIGKWANTIESWRRANGAPGIGPESALPQLNLIYSQIKQNAAEVYRVQDDAAETLEVERWKLATLERPGIIERFRRRFSPEYRSSVPCRIADQRSIVESLEGSLRTHETFYGRLAACEQLCAQAIESYRK